MEEISVNEKYPESVNNYTYSKNDSKEALIDKGTVGIRSTSLRWVALALACLTNIGSYYSFDNPQPLQNDLVKEMDMTNVQFNLLYSLYSMPNIILPFFGGIIIDRMGVRIAIGVFAFILILGQGIVTLGVAQASYPLMLFGRIIFGLGGESLSVSQSSVIAKWFLGKELAFALGATLCVSRMGSSLNSFLSPKIYGWSGELYVPFLVGAILCAASWCSGMILGTIDKKADEQEGTENEKLGDEKINFKDLKNFKLIYFLLLFNCFFLYGAFFGLNNNLNDLMQKRFGFSSDSAGNFIPIVYICSALITPFFGRFTDAKGKRVLFMLIASCIFFLDHLVIAFLKDTTEEGRPNYGMVGVLLGIGLFYATYAAVFWPCIPLVVQKNLTGTAYGIVTSLQNLMLAIIPLVLGAVHDKTIDFHAGYFWTEITLALVVACGIAITTWMYFEDMKTGEKLNKPGSSKEKAAAQKSLSRSFGQK